MNRRMLLVLAISTAVVLSVTVGMTVLLQRESLEIRITAVGMVADTPANGLTQLRADLVLRNVGPAPLHLEFLTLFADDPVNGTLYDTFTHTAVHLGPTETLRFSETSNITGHWSQVTFTVKIFPSGAPSWDRSLMPDQPVTWTS